MENRSAYTIQALLDELKERSPTFKQGMIFETQKTIFPSNEIPKEKRNITYKEVSFTKPLACNKKDKENYIKENSPAASFFKETTRGDFLIIENIKDKVAFCRNLSLKENVVEEFYKDELIPITYKDVSIGKVKIYRRKIAKFFGEQS